MKFSGSGVFKHAYDNSCRIPQFEERIVLVEAPSIEIAEKLIVKEFNEYASDGIEFLQVFEINELCEETGAVIEIASSMKVFSGNNEEYLNRFWSDQRPESCDSSGWQHVWYNRSNGKSGCYNCQEERSGELWKNA